MHSYVSKSNTVYHESFKAEKFHSKLYMQIFAKKLSRNLTYFLLNLYLNSAMLKFHIKKFCRHTKNRNFSASKLSWYTVYMQ